MTQAERPPPWSDEHGQFLALAVRVVEAAPNAMIVVDHRGRIVFANARTELLFGYDRSQLFDQSIEVLVPRSKRAMHRSLRSRYTWEPEMRAMGTGRHVTGLHADGTEVLLEVGLSPLTAGGESLVLCSISNVTAHVELETRHAALSSSLTGLRRDLEALADGAEAVRALDRALACDGAEPTSAAATPRST